LVKILVGQVCGRRVMRDNVGLLLLMLLLLLLLLACCVESVRPLSNQAFVLSTREKGQTESPVFATVLVVVPKTVHVLVPPCAIANTASVGTKPLFDLPDLAVAHALLQHFTLLAGGKVTGPMGHVVL
jgi:hypothetical protein